MMRNEIKYSDEILEMSGNVRDVPLWRKVNLTIEEAAKYSGIGRNKLRELTDDENCPFVLWVGSKRMIKREEFEKYIRNQYSI